MPNFTNYKGIEIMEVNNEFWILEENWEFNNQFGLKTIEEAYKVIDNLKA